MPARLTHIIDETTPEGGVRHLSLLLGRLPPGRVEQQVIVIGRRPATLAAPAGVEVSRIGQRGRWPMVAGPGLSRALARQRSDVVYAWGPTAAVAAAGQRDRRPMAAIISDPANVEPCRRWWGRARKRGRGINVLCPSRQVQRKLVASGVSIGVTPVIRPGVDFAAIRRAAGTSSRAGRTSRRAEIGLPPESRVLLTASPPSRAGGQYYAVWAAAILKQVWPNVRLVIPGTSKEQKRLGRFIERIYCPEIYHLTEDRYTPAELLTLSDMLIVPALDEVATGWLPWAMAASVPIVASAVPSVTELLTDGQNAFLCRPAEPHTLATRIRTAAESGDALRQCVETARDQALEVFAARRCVDEHLKLIDRLLAGCHPGVATHDVSVEACPVPEG